MNRKLEQAEAVLQNKIGEVWDIKDSLDRSFNVVKEKTKAANEVELFPIIVNAQGAASVVPADTRATKPGFEGKVMSVNEQSNFVIVDIERSAACARETRWAFTVVLIISRASRSCRCARILRPPTSRSSRPRSKSAIPLDKEGLAASRALQIPNVKNRPNINDVARRAKVSITTVSRVINNITTVSTRNRARVEEAIAYYKYRPNISAQRLARGSNNSVGLVMPSYPGIFHSFYAVELIRGVGHACEVHHMDLVFHITNGFNPINTNNVGGVIFADVIENRKQVESALASGTPCVVINHKIDDMDVGYIAVDNVLGGRIAADYLVSLGHKKSGDDHRKFDHQAGAQRLKALKNCWKKKMFPCPRNTFIREIIRGARPVPRRNNFLNCPIHPRQFSRPAMKWPSR